MKHLKNAGCIALGAMALNLITHFSEAQVGIGTTTPQEKLHVYDGSIIGTTPELPAENDPYYDPDFAIPLHYGFMWLHDKSALRAVGERSGTGTLDKQGIGQFSFAAGYENLASGLGAVSFGLRSSAAGTASFAGGEKSYASGSFDFAFGTGAVASGGHSVAMGDQVSTNGQYSSFVFGSGGNSSLKNDKSYQMVMGFSGGYKLFTNSAQTIGVQLQSGSNAWSVISDVNKKENFAPVNGEDFLQKISKMNLTSWNYKGQDPKQYRHYGPMAQDFYKAFGQDAYGTIGSDTTINQADFDGVNLIAVQALIRRMEEMSVEIATIRAELAEARSEQGRKKKRIMAIQK
ncbi:tail fiber domain-containing protein [Dyadobacter jiangsuensis]|uniref:Endosialidase-like protein n=1 Tax=Dyadobacter jiangsuensis TaxID=1591085 RepID=A0A2P8GFV9_9BACT|nr:tail fiber domain-containing protein [Dyadobacter jiangsuensis]PSL32872.1 endosialidase-like protein [Dyadobacter jiangsuensis]